MKRHVYKVTISDYSNNVDGNIYIYIYNQYYILYTIIYYAFFHKNSFGPPVLVDDP